MATQPDSPPRTVNTAMPFVAKDVRGIITPSRLRSKDFLQVFRGSYIAAGTTLTVPIRAQAALLVAPKGSVVSHSTAAVIWGGHVPVSPMIHLSMSATKNCQREGIQVHRLVRPPKGQTFRGVLLTSPERTFCDLAAHLRLLDLVALGDRLVKRERTSPERLVLAAGNWDGPHKALVVRAAGLVRAGVDSRPESHVRMLMVLAGLPEPEVDVRLVNAVTGHVERRLDSGWRALRLAVEYDGSQHREDEEIYEGDILRHEELREQRRWRILRVTKKVYQEPAATLARIENARIERGAKPTVLSQDWRPFFKD